MGKKKDLKNIRANKEQAIRAEIRVGLATDERFLRVALGVHERHPISMEESIALVMEEYRKRVQGSGI